jgi:hypothetical protein
LELSLSHRWTPAYLDPTKIWSKSRFGEVSKFQDSDSVDDPTQEGYKTASFSLDRFLKFNRRHGSRRSHYESLGIGQDLQDQRVERRKYPTRHPASQLLLTLKFCRPRNEMLLPNGRRYTKRNGKRTRSFRPMRLRLPRSPSTPSPPPNFEPSTPNSLAQWRTPI